MNRDYYINALIQAIEAKLPEWRVFFPDITASLSGTIMAIDDSVNQTLKPFLQPGMVGGICRSKLFCRTTSSRRNKVLTIKVKGLLNADPVCLYFSVTRDRMTAYDLSDLFSTETSLLGESIHGQKADR